MKVSMSSALAGLVLLVGACAPAAQQPSPTAGVSGNNVIVSTPQAPAATQAPAPATTQAPAATSAPAAGSGATVAATSAPIAAPTASAIPVGQPSGPQEITVNALQGEPDNLDPNRSNFVTEAAVIRQVFEPLLRFDKDLNVVPGAASSFDVSPDGKTYTFHLRSGAQWSDGKAVTADDFVYSFKRLLDPDTAADYASFFVDAGIVGAADFNAGKGAADAVGVRAKDANTLVIDLEQAIGYFPNLAALWVVAPVRQDIVKKSSGWAQDPSTYVGNGAYKMSEWVHQDHITLVPNPNYNGPKPTLQKITLLMVDSAESDYAAYRNNERDWTLVPDADVQAVLADPKLSREAVQYTELTTFWLVMNEARRPLNNPLVRQAFARAIDRQALIRDIASGVGQPATSMIPPGMPGFQIDAGKDIDFDARAARALLAQAGFANPSEFPVLRFRFGSTSANQSRAEFIQSQLKQNLGISIVLDSMEAKAYQAAYKSQNFDLAWTGWGADYPDPQNFMVGLFGCGAGNNKTNYCNPQFDAAAARGDAASSLPARLQAYSEAQQILVKDVPVAPLLYQGRLVLVKPWVRDMVITSNDDYPGMSLLAQIFTIKH